MKCSFCGYEFNKKNADQCDSCPLHTKCGKLKCPNCGFEMPRENSIFRWFRRRRHRFGRGRGSGKGCWQQGRMPLSQLTDGNEAVISQVDTRDRETLNKIMALGILPGMSVTMIQRYPTFVFQVGNTRVTADEDLVNKILVNQG